jgi:hypothetical protein
MIETLYASRDNTELSDFKKNVCKMKMRVKSTDESRS